MNNETGLDSVSIPTISAMVDDDNFEEDITTKLIKSKFKKNENILSIFEAYQIQGVEYSSRLLALVVSIDCGTFAVFSMIAPHLPPKTTDELTIDNVFLLNENFNIICEEDGISKFKFKLQNGDEFPVTYFYYHEKTINATDFPTFYAQLLSAKKSMVNNSVLKFDWVNDYRRINDVKSELKRRENEYIRYNNYRIYCGTWNVNGKLRSYDSPLILWLLNSEEPPDMYAIALQELDTSAIALTMSENRPDRLWINAMVEAVNCNGSYEELTSVRLVGMMLTIIVRKELRPQILRCHVKTIGRGTLSFGNKGGVGVSLQLNEDNICFVNSHLAAHMQYVEQRNADYAGIKAGMIFDDFHQRRIENHEHIFWIGDLNYRIEEPQGLQLPNSRNALSDYECLLKYDQLRMEMSRGRCFKGYREGKITFRPTYKYDVGSDNYDSSEKQRAPAYCDRILWKGRGIEQIAYNSVMEMRQSDHKPVYAIFDVKIKTKDDKLYKRVHEQVLKLVDKHENENQPQVQVEKTVIEFGEILFNELAVRDFTVTNMSPTTVNFTFKVKDPPLNAICEKWLRVEPKAGSLMQFCAKSIRINLLVDIYSIRSLLTKIKTTNWKFDFDILILHVMEGPDTFLTVTGEYKPSCFGLSMETLCRTNRPLCKYNQTELKELMNDTTEFCATMPREFFLLIDYLHKCNKKIDGAFSSLQYKHAKTIQFNKVRDWLDTWSMEEFPGTPLEATEALLLLLDLPEKPLLDPFIEQLLSTPNVQDARNIISELSPPKRNVFFHICLFLKVGIEKGFYNITDVATTFGAVLLRNSIAIKDPLYDNKCRKFMLMILSSDIDDNKSSNVAASRIPATSTTSSSSSSTSTVFSKSLTASANYGSGDSNCTNGNHQIDIDYELL